jgi:hypothetical protein
MMINNQSQTVHRKLLTIVQVQAMDKDHSKMITIIIDRAIPITIICLIIVIII